jgi:hypothetical protein
LKLARAGRCANIDRVRLEPQLLDDCLPLLDIGFHQRCSGFRRPAIAPQDLSVLMSKGVRVARMG